MKGKDSRKELVEEDIPGAIGRPSRKRHLGLSGHIKSETGFRKNRILNWRCSNCGYLDEGREAPEICPACVNDQARFHVVNGHL